MAWIVIGARTWLMSTRETLNGSMAYWLTWLCGQGLLGLSLLALGVGAAPGAMHWGAGVVASVLLVVSMTDGAMQGWKLCKLRLLRRDGGSVSCESDLLPPKDCLGLERSQALLTSRLSGSARTLSTCSDSIQRSSLEETGSLESTRRREKESKRPGVWLVVNESQHRAPL